MSNDIEYRDIAWATRTTDCYAGDTCDQLKPQWESHFEGDKEGETFKEPFILHPEHFPPGTKVIISIPVCKKCGEDQEHHHDEECDFSFAQWELGEYS